MKRNSLVQQLKPTEQVKSELIPNDIVIGDHATNLWFVPAHVHENFPVDSPSAGRARLFQIWNDELLEGGFDKGGNKGKSLDNGNGAGKGRNSDPIAVDDLGTGFSTNADTALHTVSVLLNDFDPDLDILSVSTFDTSGTRGSVFYEGEGVFHYDPAGQFDYLKEGEVAFDTFTYIVTDPKGHQSSATVTIEIIGSTPSNQTDIEPPQDGETDAPLAPPPGYVDTILVDEALNRLNLPGPLGSASIVTFSFATMTPDYYSENSSTNQGFTEFTDAQKEATRAILDSVSQLTNLTFAETVQTDAQMVFGSADIGGRGFAYFPTEYSLGNRAADVWLDNSISDKNYDPGSEAFKTLIHEIGHALGLSHPDSDFADTTRQFSVMTAYGHSSMDGDVSTYMLYDIAALQYLYGTNADTESGDTIYDHTLFEGQIRTLWDGGGHDLIDGSDATYGLVIDLKEGSFSTIDPAGTNNLGLAYGTVIEDANGSAFSDVLIGNTSDNSFTGGAGSDVFRLEHHWGADVITDFEYGSDKLDLSGLGLAFSDLVIEHSSSGALVSHGEDSVLLAGLDAALLEASDFLFS